MKYLEKYKSGLTVGDIRDCLYDAIDSGLNIIFCHSVGPGSIDWKYLHNSNRDREILNYPDVDDSAILKSEFKISINNDDGPNQLYKLGDIKDAIKSLKGLLNQEYLIFSIYINTLEFGITMSYDEFLPENISVGTRHLSNNTSVNVLTIIFYRKVSESLVKYNNFKIENLRTSAYDERLLGTVGDLKDRLYGITDLGFNVFIGHRDVKNPSGFMEWILISEVNEDLPLYGTVDNYRSESSFKLKIDCDGALFKLGELRKEIIDLNNSMKLDGNSGYRIDSTRILYTWNLSTGYGARIIN